MVTERYKDRDVKGLSGNIREMGEDQPQDPDGLSLAFAKKSSRGHRVGQLRGCPGSLDSLGLIDAQLARDHGRVFRRR